LKDAGGVVILIPRYLNIFGWVLFVRIFGINYVGEETFFLEREHAWWRIN
jgi:hypothetical protein